MEAKPRRTSESVTELFEYEENRIKVDYGKLGSSSEYFRMLFDILGDKLYICMLPNGAVCFSNLTSKVRKAIVLMPTQSISFHDDGYLEYTSREDFGKLIRMGVLSVKLVGIVKVNDPMLRHAYQMAEHIKNILGVNDSIPIEKLSEVDEIIVDTNMNSVLSVFDNHNPYPMVAGNFGFVVNADKHHQLPLFAVTGYVEFIFNLRENKFTPIVHVADIVIVKPVTSVYKLALALAAEVFINHGLWRQQFESIEKSYLPDICNLLVDNNDTSKVYSAKQYRDIEMMFVEYISPPILAIDVRDNTINSPLADIASKGNELFSETTGMYEIGGVLRDTRDINYFNLLSKFAYIPDFESFKSRGAMSDHRFTDIESLGIYHVTPLWRSRCIRIAEKCTDEIMSVISSCQYR